MPYIINEKSHIRCQEQGRWSGYRYEPEWPFDEELTYLSDSGLPLPASCLPKRVLIDEIAQHHHAKCDVFHRHHELDFFFFTHGFAVSERVRQILDELEPGRIEYSDLEVCAKNGRIVAHSPCFYVTSLPRIEAIIWERSDFGLTSVYDSRGRQFVMPLERQTRWSATITVSSAVIDGRHIWREASIGQQYRWPRPDDLGKQHCEAIRHYTLGSRQGPSLLFTSDVLIERLRKINALVGLAPRCIDVFHTSPLSKAEKVGR